MLRRLRDRVRKELAPDLPPVDPGAEDKQFQQIHPEQWREAGQRMGLRNLTHRKTTTEWRGD